MSDNKGWECPKCERVYAPHVDECKHCSGGLAPLPELPKLPVLPQLPHYRPIWVTPDWYYNDFSRTWHRIIPARWVVGSGTTSGTITINSEDTTYTLIN